MAQLRDAKTGELVLEGTPLELVVVVRKLGVKGAVPQQGAELGGDVEVIYDDVGLGFNPDAVLESAQADADGTAGAAKVAKGDDKKTLTEAAAAKRAALEPDVKRAEEVTKALEAARRQHRG